MSAFVHRSLRDVLLEKGLVAAEALTGWDAGADPLGAELLRPAAVTEQDLAQALAELYRLPYIDLDAIAVAPELFRLLPAARAYELGVVPCGRRADTLEVAISDPTDLTMLDRLERLTGLRVTPVLTTRNAIEAALKRGEGSSEVLRDLSETFRPVIVKEDEVGAEHTVSLDETGEAAPVVRLINSIIRAALQKRASDVHIETYERGVNVKYRIDGVLYAATEPLDRSHHAALVSRLKVMAELDIAEKRIPQDGRFRLRLAGNDIDFRVSVLPSVHGEDVVIRVLDKSAITDGLRQLDLEHLGIEASMLRSFRRAIREPYGMVLITGPTGSGKTTTLYAALSELNSGEEKIITIEDPVEYQLEGVVQVPVNEKKSLTFASGLRSILRHDPDKIMVGEIRDPDTAQIAVQAALTGHLVFTTVHANNVFDVLGRFAHMGIDLHNFVSALNCVVAQRLLRLLCPACKRPVQPEAQELQLSGVDPQCHPDATWFEPHGCEQCGGTGYHGRAAIVELLDLSPRMRQLISAQHSTGELAAAAADEGMRSLRESALDKAAAGLTSLREVNRVTFVE